VIIVLSEIERDQFADSVFKPSVNLTVVDIIQTGLRIIRIVDHQGPTQAIAVLGLVMAVIPIGPLK
jgi:hypothetical protein